MSIMSNTFNSKTSPIHSLPTALSILIIVTITGHKDFRTTGPQEQQKWQRLEIYY